MGVEISLQRIEHFRQVPAQPLLVRIVAHHIGAADIRLPFVEHRPQIEEHRVVRRDDAHRRVVGEDPHRVGAGANDALVPVLLHPERLLRQDIDVRVDFGLAGARTHQAPGLDRRQQFIGALFGGQQGRQSVVRTHAAVTPDQFAADQFATVP